VGYEFRLAVDQVPALSGAHRLPTQSEPLHISRPQMWPPIRGIILQSIDIRFDEAGRSP